MGASGRRERHVAVDETVEKAIRRFLSLLEGEFPVEGAYLFGSRARGSHSPDSDADVAVILGGEPRRFLPVKLAMVDVAYDVLLDTGVDISPLPVWRCEWNDPDGYPSPALLRNIAGEGIRL